MGAVLSFSFPLSLHLLKTLSTLGRAGVPMEVMGLMLGEFVDDYTIRVADVFAMPQVRFFFLSSFSMADERDNNKEKKPRP